MKFPPPCAAVLLALVAGGARADYASTVLSDSPLLYYRFEEDAADTIASDSSGNGNESIASSNAAFGTAGAVGNGVRFSGNGFLVTGLTLNPAEGDFSIEALVQATPAAGSMVAISNQDGTGTGRSNILIDSAGSLNAFVGGSSNSSGAILQKGQWTHFILTYDASGGANALRFYIDGQPGNIGDETAEDANGNWVIGAHKSTTSQFFNGMLDEVAIYNYRLDDPDDDDDLADSRVAAHYDAYVNPTEPLITSFVANPIAIRSGGAARLEWQTSESVTSLGIDQGLGPVTPLNGAGSETVAPGTTTTYTLTASDGADTATATATVFVDVASSMRINEIMAVNGGPVTDEDGDESDWIELENTSAAPVDLGGWHLTDDPLALTKWQFPPTAVGNGDFLLLFASGKDRAVGGSELHTNFRIGGSGEFLALVEPDGTTIHHALGATIPPQRTGISYGVVDASGMLGYFTNPTPESANDPNSVAGFVEEPVTADFERGFYDAPFDVALSTLAANADIYFTTDGSDPSPQNGTLYSGPIPVATTTTLRAAPFRPSEAPLKITTHSYIFLDDVLDQPANPPGFPAAWQPSVAADYAFDRSVGSDAELKASLQSLGTLSLVMNVDAWFNNTNNPDVGGIYSNSTIARGFAWEKPVSAEFFGFDHGQVLQVDCGIRVFGNASRALSRKKHNLRLVFRSSYGPSELVFPVFGDDAVPDTVNSYLLRGQNGDSWFHPSAGQRAEALYMRDQLARSLHEKMGQPETRQGHVHLYINGLYWGVFNTIERNEDNSMSQKFGGPQEEWDVLKSSRQAGMEAVDGNLDAWNQMHALAEAGVTDPADYAAIGAFLDFANLADFLLTNFYNGNVDWDDNNFQTARRRQPGEKWKFFVWDSERTLLSPGQNSTTRNFSGRATRLHHRLKENPEYRLLFADRTHRHLFNDGILTPDRVKAELTVWADRLRVPLLSESARWGDTLRAGNPYTVDDEWQAEVDFQLDSYMATRTGTVFGQLRSQGLYPDVEAPSFNEHGGTFPAGFQLAMSAPSGEIYYTLDGSDPRLPADGGGKQTTLIDEGASCTAFLPTDGSLGLAWTATTYEDGAWTDGTTGVGFESAPDAFAELLSLALPVGTASAYLRLPFAIPDQAALDAIRQLTLNMKYDDGFVAYINGTVVARSDNAPDPVQWNSTANGGHPDSAAIVFESFDASAGVPALRIGDNVLAIHALNASPNSSDMLCLPQLVGAPLSASGISPTAIRYTGPVALGTPALANARVLDDGEWSALNSASFFIDTVPASAANLVVSEFHYHPESDDNGLEFVELLNIGGRPIDLRGVRFVDGIDFDFSSGIATPTPTLNPGEHLVLVGNPEDFAANRPAVPFAGAFGGNLENDGEQVILEAANGSTIRDFTYNDKTPWPEPADGDGPSLVLIRPFDNPDHADPANWRTSTASSGSPGADDSVAFPGGDATALIAHATGAARPFTRSTVGADGHLRLTLPLNLAAEDVLVQLEHSTDLATWTVATGFEIHNTSHLASGLSERTWRSTAPIQESPMAYYRWLFTLPRPPT